MENSETALQASFMGYEEDISGGVVPLRVSWQTASSSCSALLREESENSPLLPALFFA